MNENKQDTEIDWQLIENNLLNIYDELKNQDMSKYDDNEQLSYEDGMKQIFEFIDLAGEYGLAYEYLTGYLEDYPCTLSGKAAVKLLELGLIFKYKTENEEDVMFDSRG